MAQTFGTLSLGRWLQMEEKSKAKRERQVEDLETAERMHWERTQVDMLEQHYQLKTRNREKLLQHELIDQRQMQAARERVLSEYDRFVEQVSTRPAREAIEVRMAVSTPCASRSFASLLSTLTICSYSRQIESTYTSTVRVNAPRYVCFIASKLSVRCASNYR